MVVFAWVGAFRLGGDAYQHFVRSVGPFRDGEPWLILTDVWNKPLIGLLYGLSGLAGFEAARTTAALVTGAALLLTYRAALSSFGAHRSSAFWAAALFGVQLGVLKDGFTTMTEIPSAAALAGAAGAFFSGRLWMTALCLSVVPLLRVEMAMVVAPLGLWVAAPDLARGRWTRVLGLGLLTAAPTVFWLMAGAVITGEKSWFSNASYASLRSFELGGLLRYNAFVGLPRALPGPVLLLLFLGLMSVLRPLAAPRPRGSGFLVIGALAHLILISLVDVYPDGDGAAPAGHAVAAINDRNFTPSGPLLALIAAFGWLDAASLPSGPALKRVLLAAGLALAAVLIRHGLRADAVAPALTIGLTALVLGRSRQALSGAWLLALALAGALLVRPLFFYPFRWVEQETRAVEALATAVQEANPRPRRVVQDIASGLFQDPRFAGCEGAEVGCAATDIVWRWPSHFETGLDLAAGPVWVVVALDRDGDPHPRYPASIIQLVQSMERCEPVASFASRPNDGIIGFLDRLSRRNRPRPWRACRVVTPVETHE